MNQTWPKATQRQLWKLLSALLRGERLSTIAALTYGCGACSQRMNDLRRLGWPIVHENVRNKNGGYHFEYYLVSRDQFMLTSTVNDPTHFNTSPDFGVSA